MARDWPHLPKFQSEEDASADAPEGWSTRQIEDIFDKLEIGKRFDQKTSFVSGRVPVVDQSADGFVGFHDEKPGVVASDTSPVITFANHTCEMRVMRRPFSVIQNVFPMVGRLGVCDTLFFYYATKGRVHLEEYKGHYPDFRRLWINLPPLAEQKAIAAVLGALDDKIELNRRMNATLEAMARALFQSWFVDFDPVRAKLDGRQPSNLDPATAALFPEYLEDSPLGHIPKGWKVGRIQDCCVQIQNGGTPRRNEPRFWDGGNVPWLASGEVRQSIITATESFITEEGLAESSAKWVPAFSTVVALYGATAGQVSFTSSRLTTNQAVCALIPKKDFAFFNYLTMREATAELENKAVGSAQQNISKGIVEETKVVLPPPALVERFAATASPLFERWISNLHQSRTLATLRDTLLPKLLSGDLNLNP